LAAIQPFLEVTGVPGEYYGHFMLTLIC